MAATDWLPRTYGIRSTSEAKKLGSATKKPAFAGFPYADFRIVPHFADLSIDNRPKKK
jgi:hypothetical protein